MLPDGFRPDRLQEQQFTVSFDYPVVFCRGVFDSADPSLAWAIARRERRRHPIVAVVDNGLAAASPGLLPGIAQYAERHSELLELRRPPLVIPGGERCKNDPALVGELCRAFRDAGLDRHAVVLIVGGGAVLDAAGYAAAITHRGVRVVRMPSTVLAQSDGGVGVKNGVNAHGAKNFLGTFAPPFAVVNDAGLLETLGIRDTRAGMAEAVKVALIRDAEFFDWLEANAAELRDGELEHVETLVERAARIHLDHIARGGDPFELGSQRPLDYGHWVAHRLEIASNHALRHGEAVAVGMLVDARYAERIGLLTRADLLRVSALLQALGLPRFHPVLAERRAGRLAVLDGLDEFREHLGGALTVTLLTGIGRSTQVTEIDPAVVAEAVDWASALGEA